MANYVHACQLKEDDPRIKSDEECDPNVCPSDPRLVCAVDDWAVGWQPAHIANALKGDLILSPADGSGLIGTLLGAVQPPQVYDHMGIMVENHSVIRHCTQSKDRLLDPKYFTGVLIVEGAPTDGVRDDHLTYGWPGAITQTIEDAFYTGLRGPYNPEWSSEGQSGSVPPAIDPKFLAISPEEREFVFPGIWKSLKFVDPEENFTFDDPEENLVDEPYRYEIRNLPHDPALRKSSDPGVRKTDCSGR